MHVYALLALCTCGSCKPLSLLLPLQEFETVHGYYTPNVEQLTQLPEYVAKGFCAAVPKVNASTHQYEATCVPYTDDLPSYVGHIRYDRLIWFTEG